VATVKDLDIFPLVALGMVSNWKRQLLDGAPDLFNKNQKSRKQAEAQTNELFRQIGQLKVENDFLSRKLSS
jgi:hypothetical protein